MLDWLTLSKAETERLWEIEMGWESAGAAHGVEIGHDDDDFCIIHGRDHMKCDQGPIPYCAECDREKVRDTGDELGQILSEALKGSVMERDIVDRLMDFENEGITSSDRYELRRDAAMECAHLRAKLQQIAHVCRDNAAPTCDKRMALNFVRQQSVKLERRRTLVRRRDTSLIGARTRWKSMLRR